MSDQIFVVCVVGWWLAHFQFIFEKVWDNGTYTTFYMITKPNKFSRQLTMNALAPLPA